jgi:hypothetical protein
MLSKTILISAVMAIIEVYFREIVGNDYALLPVVIAEIILFIIIFQLPILYSLLICIIGYLIGFIAETFIILIGSSTGITSLNLIGSSVVHLFGIELVTAILTLLIAWFLQVKKLGFQFVAKHLLLKKSLKGYNFLLSGLVLLGVVGMQFQLITLEGRNIKLYIQFLLTAIFLIAIVVAYFYNKKQIKTKYERLAKNESNR